MARYRAIVSITFNDEELDDLAKAIGARRRVEPFEALTGELDNFGLGTYWIEQVFRDREPTMVRLSGGIQVEISDHEEE